MRLFSNSSIDSPIFLKTISSIEQEPSPYPKSASAKLPMSLSTPTASRSGSINEKRSIQHPTGVPKTARPATPRLTARKKSKSPTSNPLSWPAGPAPDPRQQCTQAHHLPRMYPQSHLTALHGFKVMNPLQK